MKIVLHSSGKRFERHWLFRNLDYTFEQDTRYAITGANGSGKTSLMLCLCKFIMLSEGEIIWYTEDNKAVEADKYHRLFSICSPHMELPEEFTVMELLHLQHQLNTKYTNTPYSIEEIIDRAYLSPFTNKYIYQLSSGTQQRLKLAMAIFSEKPVLLLDEFSSHLDEKAKAWAHHHLSKVEKKIVIISSNDPSEYENCTHRLDLGNLS